MALSSSRAAVVAMAPAASVLFLLVVLSAPPTRAARGLTQAPAPRTQQLKCSTSLAMELER